MSWLEPVFLNHGGGTHSNGPKTQLRSKYTSVYVATITAAW